MEEISSLQRALLPIAFFGGLVAVLMISDSLGPTAATTVIRNTDTAPQVEQTPPPAETLPSCVVDSDCPLPTTYCGEGGKCVELDKPVCDCSQPQVLRCYEASGKARFLFCPELCTEEENGATCQ